MTLPVVFYLLVWVFATPDAEREIFFANRFPSKIECNSKAAEFREQIVADKEVKPLYSRFVCVPVPGEQND